MDIRYEAENRSDDKAAAKLATICFSLGMTKSLFTAVANRVVCSVRTNRTGNKRVTKCTLLTAKFGKHEKEGKKKYEIIYT